VLSECSARRGLRYNEGVKILGDMTDDFTDEDESDPEG
jgi:hypothetical protein